MQSEIEVLVGNSYAVPIDPAAGSVDLTFDGPVGRFIIDTGGASSGDFSIYVVLTGAGGNYTATITAFTLSDIQTAFTLAMGSTVTITPLGGTQFLATFQLAGYSIVRAYVLTDTTDTALATVNGQLVGIVGALNTITVTAGDSAATVQTAFENSVSVGSGNCTVTAITGGYRFTFGGTLANLDLGPIVASSNSWLQTANTVAVAETVIGAANDTSTLTFTETRGYTAPVLDKWLATDTGGGTFSVTLDAVKSGQTLNGVSLNSQGSVDGSGIIINYTSGDTFTIDMGGSTTGAWSLNYSTNAGSGAISINGIDAAAITAGGKVGLGLPDVPEVLQQFTIGGTSGVGVNGFNLTWSNFGGFSGANKDFPGGASAFDVATGFNTFWGGTTATGNIAAGFVVTLGAPSVSPVGFVGTIYGRAQTQTLQTTDSPDRGNVKIVVGSTTIYPAYNAVAGAISVSGWTITGTDIPSGLTFTSNTYAADVTFTAGDDTDTPALLQKALAAVVVTTQEGVPGSPPTAPTLPSATAISTSEIDLAWTAGTTNAGVKVQMSLDGSTGWTLIATTAANATSYHVTTGLSAGTQYYFRMAATNAFGDSSWSATVNATTSSESSSSVLRSKATISLGASL